MYANNQNCAIAAKSSFDTGRKDRRHKLGEQSQKPICKQRIKSYEKKRHSSTAPLKVEADFLYYEDPWKMAIMQFETFKELLVIEIAEQAEKL